MSPARRRLANILAAVFLVSVGVAVLYGIWELRRGPNPEHVDTAPLVSSANEFIANEPATAGMIEVHECTGEGSVPALVERPFESAGHNTEVEADLVRQAELLGWTPGTYRLEREGQVLTIRSDPPDRPPGSVWLYVESKNAC